MQKSLEAVIEFTRWASSGTLDKGSGPQLASLQQGLVLSPCDTQAGDSIGKGHSRPLRTGLFCRAVWVVWAQPLDSCDCPGPAVRQHSTVGIPGEGWTARSLTSSAMKQKGSEAPQDQTS